MSTENLAGATEAEATVLLDENGNAVSAVIDLPTGEPEPETPEAAVQIAQIEADKEITIAAIHADTEVAAIEARQETDVEVSALRERNTWLENELANTQELNRDLQAEVSRLTPPPLPEPETETVIVAEIDPATLTTDTSETSPETSSSTETEPQSESGEGNPVAEAEGVVHAVRRRTRLL